MRVRQSTQDLREANGVWQIDREDIFELGDRRTRCRSPTSRCRPDREIDVRAAVEQCPKARCGLVDEKSATHN